MKDNRSSRHARVIPFLTRLEKDRNKNLNQLIDLAKSLVLEGFEKVAWNDHTWVITAGRLLQSSGRNMRKAPLKFTFSKNLSSNEEPFPVVWADLIKSLMVLRFHQKNQNIGNQKAFITVAGYIAHEMLQSNKGPAQINHEHLNNVCVRLSQDYSESTAYRYHRIVGEFAAHCDENSLCKSYLNYKFDRLNRPQTTGGESHQRLDDPATLETVDKKLIAPAIYQIIAELYKVVPQNHKHRFYILILTLLACTGRRFSEIALLPHQKVQIDGEKSYIYFFPRKLTQGDILTPKRRLYIASDLVAVVNDVINELDDLCADARRTAEEMQRSNGPDLRFLSKIGDTKKLYKPDLVELGLPSNLVKPNGWIRENGYAHLNKNNLTIQGNRAKHPSAYTYKYGVIEYCKKDFNPALVKPYHIDQFGTKYYLKDLLLVRNVGSSSGAYCHWLSTSCTHSMISSFLRYFPAIVNEFLEQKIEVDFSSHHFRHTLNTMLDEGGLSDVLQTRWFERKSLSQTKEYQHTSREKRILMIREEIKSGRAKGQLTEQIINLPVEHKEAVIRARVNAVHDVGTGLCIHNFSQLPCQRHLQCSADCKDYVWLENDDERKEELKRQFSIAKISQETIEKQLKKDVKKKSGSWFEHNQKKLDILGEQLKACGVEDFDYTKYLENQP